MFLKRIWICGIAYHRSAQRYLIGSSICLCVVALEYGAAPGARAQLARVLPTAVPVDPLCGHLRRAAARRRVAAGQRDRLAQEGPGNWPWSSFAQLYSQGLTLRFCFFLFAGKLSQLGIDAGRGRTTRRPLVPDARARVLLGLGQEIRNRLRSLQRRPLDQGPVSNQRRTFMCKI